MKAWTHWQDWIVVLAGVYIALVPLATADSSDGATAWVAVGLGLGIASFGLWALARPGSVVPEWINVSLGSLLALAPLALGYTELSGATWNAVVVGVTVVVLSLWSAVLVHQRGVVAAPVEGPPATERIRGSDTTGRLADR